MVVNGILNEIALAHGMTMLKALRGPPLRLVEGAN